MGQKKGKGKNMYCSNCGKKLDEGEICLCEVLGENPEMTEANLPSQHNGKSVKKKPSRKKVLAGIIAGVISFIITSTVIPAVFEKLSEKYTPENSEVDIFEGIEDDFILSSSDLEYSKGIVKGNNYSNPWANFKINLDPRFAEGTEADYESYESLLNDCGAYFIADDDGDDISIIFYDAGNTSVTEYATECLDIWQNMAEDLFEETYSESFIQKITFRREARVTEIAGEKYLAVFLTAESPDGFQVVYGDFCAMKDKRIIDISFSADNIEECIELARLFEMCNGYDI